MKRTCSTVVFPAGLDVFLAFLATKAFGTQSALWNIPSSVEN